MHHQSHLQQRHPHLPQRHSHSHSQQRYSHSQQRQSHLHSHSHSQQRQQQQQYQQQSQNQPLECQKGPHPPGSQHQQNDHNKYDDNKYDDDDNKDDDNKDNDNKDNDKRKTQQIALKCLIDATTKPNQTVSEFVGGVLCALREACPIYFSKNRLSRIITGYSETNDWNDYEKSIWLMRSDRIDNVFCDIMYKSNAPWKQEQKIAKDMFLVYTEYRNVHKREFIEFSKRFENSPLLTSNTNTYKDKVASLNNIQKEQQKEYQQKQNNNNNNNNFSDREFSPISYMSSSTSYSVGAKQSKRKHRHKKGGGNHNNNNNQTKAKNQAKSNKKKKNKK